MLGKKALLALASLALVLVVLEVGAWRVVAGLGPVKVRDGLYANPLPLITGVGGPPLDLRYLPRGERLAAERGPDEVRIAVFGESSVEGSPFDVEASFPAMLLDYLEENVPGRTFTVVNMGRSASIATNVYYYLMYIHTYRPDYVVFYMGMNDDPQLPGEPCMLGESPRLYGVWQALAERSWLLWLTRAYGPQIVWKHTGKSDWYGERDCSVPTFGLWTRELTRLARASGARVVIANPVMSALEPLEPTEHPSDRKFPAKSDEYRRLLACALTEGCDLTARLLDDLAKPATEGGPSRLELHRRDLESRAAAWRAAALEYGAAQIPFHRLLAAISPHGLLAETYFADRQHLSPPGYLFLARLVGERLRLLMTGQPERPVAAPHVADLAPYLAATHSSGLSVLFEQFRRGHALAVVDGLRFSMAAFGGQPPDPRFASEVARARIAWAWLRTVAGLDHGLPPELVPELEAFDPFGDFYKKTTL